MIPQQQDVSMMLHVPADQIRPGVGVVSGARSKQCQGHVPKGHWLAGYMAASKGFTDVCCAEVVYIPDHRVAMLRQPPLDDATQVCLRTSTATQVGNLQLCLTTITSTMARSFGSGFWCIGTSTPV
jgi:hypothetical protein